MMGHPRGAKDVLLLVSKVRGAVTSEYVDRKELRLCFKVV